MNAPIILFSYNRKDKIERLINSLSECRGIISADVIIFSDGPKNDGAIQKVNEVRDYLDSIAFHNRFNSLTIVKREVNFGLAKSIISGVTEIINKYGKAIVLEDDLIVSKDFVDYMNAALDYYENDDNVGEISAYTMPIKGLKRYKDDVYFTRCGDCWGWATWKRVWNNCDWELTDFDSFLKDEGKVYEVEHLHSGLINMLKDQKMRRTDTWAARWIFHLYIQNYLTVYPKVCRTVNEGFDGTGVNCDFETRYRNCLYEGEKPCRFIPSERNESLERQNYKFSIMKPPVWKICFNRIWMIAHRAKMRLLNRTENE